MDEFSVKHGLNFVFYFVFLKIWITVWASVYGFGIGEKVDVMINISLGKEFRLRIEKVGETKKDGIDFRFRMWWRYVGLWVRFDG